MYYGYSDLTQSFDSKKSQSQAQNYDSCVWWKRKERPVRKSGETHQAKGEGQKMRTDITHLNPYRLTSGPLASTVMNGINGVFIVPCPLRRFRLCCLSSDQLGWEHVSVSVVAKDGFKVNRVPSYEELMHVRDLFWKPEEWVVQYFPAKEEHVNVHPYTLHLWRTPAQAMPTPPKLFV